MVRRRHSCELGFVGLRDGQDCFLGLALNLSNIVGMQPFAEHKLPDCIGRRRPSVS